MFAPSPMIRPRSAAFASDAGVAAGRDEHQLVERRRRGLGVLAVDRLGLEAALDHAARDELGRPRRRRPRRAGERVEPDRQRSDVRGPTSRRIADRADLDARLAIELVGRSPAATATTRLTGSSPARRARSLKRLPRELAEVGEGRELAAGPAVELAQRAGEVGLADDRHDEDVCLGVPRLTGDDADLQGRVLPDVPRPVGTRRGDG